MSWFGPIPNYRQGRWEPSSSKLIARERGYGSSVTRRVQFPQQPALQLIYDTAPIGLAFLSPDCRYLQINQRLTEICGISIEGHLGRTVRDLIVERETVLIFGDRHRLAARRENIPYEIVLCRMFSSDNSRCIVHQKQLGSKPHWMV
jgi:PAS domain-containing protein